MRDVLRVASLLCLALIVPACHNGDDDDDSGGPAPGPGPGPGPGGGGSIQFAADRFAVMESDPAGNAVLRIVRTGGTAGRAEVRWQTGDADGNATHGSDFSGREETLAWADGEGGEKEIRIPVRQDSDPEGDETFHVFLGSNSGAVLGLPNVAEVTIQDDDAGPGGAFQFQTKLFAVDEGLGSVVTIVVTRTGGSLGAAQVQVMVTPGTATSQDYTADSFTTLTWADGDSSPRSFNIGITQDNLSEGEEHFNLELVNAVGGVVGTTRTAQVRIIDDDFAGALSFDASQYTVHENGGSVKVTVNRSGGSKGAVSVTLDAVNGTATKGEDFIGLPFTLSWGDGDTLPKSFDIPVTNDQIVEGDEEATLTLTNPTPGVFIGSPATARLIIFDVVTKTP